MTKGLHREGVDEGNCPGSGGSGSGHCCSWRRLGGRRLDDSKDSSRKRRSIMYHSIMILPMNIPDGQSAKKMISEMNGCIRAKIPGTSEPIFKPDGNLSPTGK